MNTDFATGIAKSHGPVHGRNVEQIALTYGLRPEEIIDFSANINTAGPPAGVMVRLAELVPIMNWYPVILSLIAARCATFWRTMLAWGLSA